MKDIIKGIVLYIGFIILILILCSLFDTVFGVSLLALVGA